MKNEKDYHVAFLDIHVYKRHNSSLVHGVYRKLTHTNLYPSATSLHHPANKQPVLSTLGYETPQQHRKNPASVVFLPFVGNIFNHINRVQTKHNIKMVVSHQGSSPAFSDPRRMIWL
jgi:hypothetical protein